MRKNKNGKKLGAKGHARPMKKGLKVKNKKINFKIPKHTKNVIKFI